jgi:HAD superfamily hydrolase (TIGR01490 family)
MRTAAFYDLDGTLLNGNVVTHYLYFAKTDSTWTGRARRLAGTALSAPLYMALDKLDRRTFNEFFYTSYAGLSEDRLFVLGEELFEKELRRRLFPGAKDLVARDRDLGHLTVLLTGALEFVAEPAARFLGIERVAASKLEFTAERLATGKLVPPVLAGPEKATWARRFAAEESIDLDGSKAYADDASDLPILSVVGKPVAVNPSVSLRAAARAHRWPVVELATRRDARGMAAQLIDNVSSWMLGK